MGKNYIAGFTLTVMYLILNFCMKYSGGLFNDFWGIDDLKNQIILGYITVTVGFIISILVGVVFGLIYDLFGIKLMLDPIFKDTFLWDSD